MEWNTKNYTPELMLIVTDKEGTHFIHGKEIYVDAEAENNYLFNMYHREDTCIPISELENVIEDIEGLKLDIQKYFRENRGSMSERERGDAVGRINTYGKDIDKLQALINKHKEKDNE